MFKELKELFNKTETLNGAATYRSSGKFCLDLFSSIGAMRNLSDEEIWKRFELAFGEDKNLAIKILFYARDVRGGLGEREVFRTILKTLSNASRTTLIKNLPYIAEYGRYDDLLVLLDTNCKKEVVQLISEQLKQDLANIQTDNVSLLAKWLPSINATNSQTVKLGKRLAQCLNMTEKEYRQILSKLRKKIKIIENNLREKDYTFDYSKQPSKAMFKYKKAFIKNDRERYIEFLNKVQRGEVNLNTGTLYPYEIIAPLYSINEEDENQINAISTTWYAQKDYTNSENALVVVDGSGSMYWDSELQPATVAQSLAIYFAERNNGEFKNHFITFSENPQLVEIKGNNILEKVRYCASFNECANTNIQKVFELILQTAIKNKISKSDMPKTIYIISDMEFDCCSVDADLTNFEYIKYIFNTKGYNLPKLVFWNVNPLQQQVPVKENEQGVILVSGCSPKIFEMVMSGETSPYKFMLDILNSERYEKITA